MRKKGFPKGGNGPVLEGILIPTAWDEKGHPVQFSLFTFDEKEYEVDSSRGMGGEIVALLRKKVRASIRQRPRSRATTKIIIEEIREIPVSEK